MTAAKFTDLPASAFPFTVELLDAETREVVWSATSDGPGVMRIPGLDETGPRLKGGTGDAGGRHCAGNGPAVSCPLCGDESVHRDVAAMSDPLLLMVVEGERLDWMEHLRAVHPQEHAREQAKEQEMNDALAGIFGGKKK